MTVYGKLNYVILCKYYSTVAFDIYCIMIAYSRSLRAFENQTFHSKLLMSVYRYNYQYSYVATATKYGTAARMEKRIERYRNGEWCEMFSVGNCNGKNM